MNKEIVLIGIQGINYPNMKWKSRIWGENRPKVLQTVVLQRPIGYK